MGSTPTGFFVGIPSQVRPLFSYFYFVTAKHVVASLDHSELGIVVNSRDAGACLRPLPKHWYYHPTDPSADVAVVPFPMTMEWDTLSVPTSQFLLPELMQRKQIGIGDEVFFPGLFTLAHGTKRNMPILRHGTIAMLPEEQIQTSSGYMDAYLIEARSIGGISGSPVFVRNTIS